MIVAELKPLAEIAASLAGLERVHVLACGGCVTVCRSGGEAEARALVLALSHPQHGAGPMRSFTVASFERQCERDLMESFLKLPPDADAILSLACGVGVQILADMVFPKPVIPALSTTFMGGTDEPGVWKEKCSGCGDCLLATTAAVCPITRCAKSLLNGPCGGSSAGMCEVGDGTPCAWALIIERLTAQGRLDLLTQVRLARSWRKAGGDGPRTRTRTGVANDQDRR